MAENSKTAKEEFNKNFSDRSKQFVQNCKYLRRNPLPENPRRNQRTKYDKAMREVVAVVADAASSNPALLKSNSDFRPLREMMIKQIENGRHGDVLSIYRAANVDKQRNPLMGNGKVRDAIVNRTEGFIRSSDTKNFVRYFDTIKGDLHGSSRAKLMKVATSQLGHNLANGDTENFFELYKVMRDRSMKKVADKSLHEPIIRHIDTLLANDDADELNEFMTGIKQTGLGGGALKNHLNEELTKRARTILASGDADRTGELRSILNAARARNIQLNLEEAPVSNKLDLSDCDFAGMKMSAGTTDRVMAHGAKVSKLDEFVSKGIKTVFAGLSANGAAPIPEEPCLTHEPALDQA